MDKQKIDAVLRHPFFLAMVGTILGSALIPWIAGRAQKNATLKEQEIKQAIEVMVTSSSVNATLNRMKTAFESFEVHALPSSPSIYKERWKELEETTSKLYGDFDSMAWWWPWNIYYQARLLELVPKERLPEFERLILKYNENLVQTAQLMGKPWDAYLTGDPNPAGKKPIMEGLDKQLRSLQQERNDLTVKMASQFQ
jgi:hypothetical protein